MQIAIVEDNRLILENLRLLLDGEAGISVVGAFISAEDALPELYPLSLFEGIVQSLTSRIRFAGDCSKLALVTRLRSVG